MENGTNISMRFISYLTIYFVFSISLITGLDFDSNAISQAEDQDNIENFYFFQSRNKNIEWSDIEVISESIVGGDININGSFNPKIAVEGDKIYVVWQDWTNISNNGDDSDIFYRHFDGNSWSDIQVISEPVQGQDLNTRDSGDPSIAVNNGKIYVVWDDSNNINNAGFDYDIFYRCNLNGNGWEDIQVISEPVFGNFFNNFDSSSPDISVENDKIYVVWHDKNNTKGAGGDYDIFYRCNLSGSNWEPVQVISEPIFGQNVNKESSMSPEIAVEYGKIYVVWQDENNTNGAGRMDHDIFYICNITGSSWEPVQVISEPIQGKNYNVKLSIDPKIAVENGKVYTVWEDSNDTNNANKEDSDIFYRCNLNGISWEPIQVISEPIKGKNLNTGISQLPNIAVENNKIYVVWEDINETNNAGQDRDIFFKCNLTGYSWEPTKVISEPINSIDTNIGMSRGTDIAINSGKSHFVWWDGNNTNNANTDFDIFYRNIHLPLIISHPSVTPTLGNTSTIFTYRVKYSHLNNIKPSEIVLKISGIEYSMIEVNPNDLNYIDGKDYIFNIKNLDIGVNTYQFYASDGVFSWSTPLAKKPEVYNTPPIITTEDNLTAFEDVYFKVDCNYEDIDLTNVGQSVTWEFSTNADWLTFDTSTAIFNGTPKNDDVGEYWVSITVNDTIDSDFTNFTLTVININDGPIILTNDTIAINEDEFYKVDYEALDVDTPQNNLIWFMSSNASWLVFNQKSAILSGLPENNDVGEFWVNISVSDGEYIDFINFTLNVINVNGPPKIITKDIAAAYEDNYYEIDFEAEDIDNVQNDLTWTIITNALWLKVDNINSIINGTPMNDDVGEYLVNISVTDGEYIDDRNFTLIVKNTNDPPKIIVKDKTVAFVRELYSVNFDVIDIDPVPNLFIWSIETNASEWLSIETTSGLLIGEPSEKEIGFYWVKVSVSDSEGGWDFHNFTLEVQKSPSQEKDTSDSSFISTESFYGLIWIIIIIVILISIIIILTQRKQKKEIIHILEKREIEVIQTVKAELLQTTPSHILLPAEASTEGKLTFPAQPVVIEQLPPKPVDQPQPTVAAKTEEQPIIAIGIPPMPQQFQLPKVTLSKEQQLNLLRERFLKGEISEETYNKLRSEIESSPDKDISLTDEEYQNQSGEEKQETSDLDEKSTELEKEE